MALHAAKDHPAANPGLGRQLDHRDEIAIPNGIKRAIGCHRQIGK